MKRAKMTIDIGNKCIRMGRPIATNEKVLFLNKDITLNLDAVMDGVCKGTVKNGQPVCPIILANFSHLPLKLLAYSPLAKVSRSSNLQIFPLQDCLTVTNG